MKFKKHNKTQVISKEPVIFLSYVITIKTSLKKSGKTNTHPQI